MIPCVKHCSLYAESTSASSHSINQAPQHRKLIPWRPPLQLPADGCRRTSSVHGSDFHRNSTSRRGSAENRRPENAGQVRRRSLQQAAVSASCWTPGSSRWWATTHQTPTTMTLSPAISIHRTLLRHQQHPTECACCNPDPVSPWFHVDTHAFARPMRTRCLPRAVGVLSARHPYRWLCTCTSETLRTNAFAWNVHRDF